jgi:hypothetical protein
MITDPSKVKLIFERLTLEQCIKWQKTYSKLIDQQSPNYKPPISSKTRKPVKPASMKWMVPIWQKGLDIVNQVIEEKRQQL